MCLEQFSEHCFGYLETLMQAKQLKVQSKTPKELSQKSPRASFSSVSSFFTNITS
jgi:hypothetical protein